MLCNELQSQKGVKFKNLGDLEQAARICGIWLRFPSTSIVPIKPFSTASFYLIKLCQQVKSVGTQIHGISTLNFLTIKQKINKHASTLAEYQACKSKELSAFGHVREATLWQCVLREVLLGKRILRRASLPSLMKYDEYRQGLPTWNKLSAFISSVIIKWS